MASSFPFVHPLELSLGCDQTCGKWITSAPLGLLCKEIYSSLYNKPTETNPDTGCLLSPRPKIEGTRVNCQDNPNAHMDCEMDTVYDVMCHSKLG